MRLVDFAPLARSVSAVGFGCASLGSRIDEKRGLAALGRAYEAGVTWFDVAPSYGDGHAENILGTFIAGKRSQVTLCTKVGLLTARPNLAARVLKPAAQRVLRIAPRLRRVAMQYHRPAQQAPLTAALIESSIQQSLKRLQTDYVDILALHEATLEDLQRQDVLRALDEIVNRGQACCIAMAGDLSVALRALTLSERIQVIQIPTNGYVTPKIRIAKRQAVSSRQVGFVTHSVFGYGGTLDSLQYSIRQQSGQRKILQMHGYCGSVQEIAAAFLLDFALASNSDGVVLLSMFEAKHLRLALDRISAVSREAALKLRDQLVLATDNTV